MLYWYSGQGGKAFKRFSPIIVHIEQFSLDKSFKWSIESVSGFRNLRAPTEDSTMDHKPATKHKRPQELDASHVEACWTGIEAPESTGRIGLEFRIESGDVIRLQINAANARRLVETIQEHCDPAGGNPCSLTAEQEIQILDRAEQHTSHPRETEKGLRKVFNEILDFVLINDRTGIDG